MATLLRVRLICRARPARIVLRHPPLLRRALPRNHALVKTWKAKVTVCRHPWSWKHGLRPALDSPYEPDASESSEASLDDDHLDADEDTPRKRPTSSSGRASPAISKIKAFASPASKTLGGSPSASPKVGRLLRSVIPDLAHTVSLLPGRPPLRRDPMKNVSHGWLISKTRTATPLVRRLPWLRCM